MISVNSLAFKRFLEIAAILKIDVDVVTDNDGDVAKLKKKYGDYFSDDLISIEFDEDESAQTLRQRLPLPSSQPRHGPMKLANKSVFVSQLNGSGLPGST